MEEQSTKRGGVEPSSDAQLEALFELDRRRRNVPALSAGVLVAALLMVLFVPVGWFFMREHFVLVQGGSALWLASLLGTWVLIRKRPAWALEHSDDLVFWLFLFVSLYSDFQVWIDTGYDSPYVLTLMFSFVGVNFFISWPAKRSAAFSLTVYAVFIAPLVFGLVPLGDARTAILYQAVLLGVAILVVGFQRHRFHLEFREFSSRMEVQSARRDLERAYQQLQELDQMKSEFFANISHELRTPLTLILSPVDALLETMERGADRDALTVVRRNATRLLRMIDDLLDLAKLEGGGLRLRVSRVDLNQLAEQVAGNASAAAKAKHVELSFASEGEPAETFGDAHRLEIVLTNLIGNAMKFTPAGGRIDVRVRHTQDGVFVEVADTGPGISQQEQARIFERFHQVERSERRKQGGVGIGLALAGELVDLHGGSLSVDSELGKGATFTMFLQRGAEHFEDEIVERRRSQRPEHPGRRAEDGLGGTPARDKAEAAAELRLSKPPPERVLLDRGRVPRVLVAEDEDDLRSFITGVLSRDYTVDAAKNGAEALELLKRNRPDLVLTDVMMPEVSGLDLTRAIKTDPSLRQIPVILLTARGEHETALEGYEAGADEFVSKPFHTKVLQARIRAHLKMRGLSLQLADQARLASAGTLAAGLAHEVKNPVNAAINAMRVLEKGGSSRVPNEKLMQLVIDALNRIDNIVSALGAHARPADGTGLAPCNVREALESTLTLLDHKLRNRVTVHRGYGAAGDVFAPARALNQVMLNLVDNSTRSGAANIWIEVKQSDGLISVAVADDGPGVPPDVVHQIFDPFFTTRVEGEGTGLGLHLSRRIAQDCGGELRYESREGGGARFVMEIPAMERAA